MVHSFTRRVCQRLTEWLTGQVTLHGGIIGWDRRNWTLVAQTPFSVTYKHVDTAHEGFPGNVTAFVRYLPLSQSALIDPFQVTHSVSNGGILKSAVHATATEKVPTSIHLFNIFILTFSQTPIMLTQHTYWNLDAFQDGTNDILDHHLQIGASRVITLDGNAIPTGEFTNVTGTPYDFRRASKIGARWNDTLNLCGQGCQGYDSCWIFDGPKDLKAGTSLWSEKSGIRLFIPLINDIWMQVLILP